MRHHIIITEYVSGGGDRSYTRDMIQHLQETNSGPGIQNTIYVIVIRTAQNTTEEQIKANLEELGARVHCCNVWDGQNGVTVGQALAAVSQNIPQGDPIHSVRVIPSAHRLIPIQRNEMQQVDTIDERRLHTLFRNLTRIFGPRLQNTDIQLFTELQRGANVRALYDQHDPQQPRQANINRAVNDAPFTTEGVEYTYSFRANQQPHTIRFTISSPMITAQHSHFNPMPTDKKKAIFRRTFRASQVDELVNIQTLEIAGYLPSHTEGNPANFTEAHIVEAVNSKPFRQKLASMGVQHVSCHFFGREDSRLLELPRDRNLPSVRVVRAVAKDQADFHRRMLNSNLCIISGDNTAVEVLALASDRTSTVMLYCAKSHKAPLCLALNAPLTQCQLLEPVRVGLAPLMPGERRNPEVVVTALRETIFFSAACKVHHARTIGIQGKIVLPGALDADCNQYLGDSRAIQQSVHQGLFQSLTPEDRADVQREWDAERERDRMQRDSVAKGTFSWSRVASKGFKGLASEAPPSAPESAQAVVTQRMDGAATKASSHQDDGEDLKATGAMSYGAQQALNAAKKKRRSRNRGSGPNKDKGPKGGKKGPPPPPPPPAPSTV